MEDMARLAVIEQNTPSVEIFNKILHALIQHITNILEFPHDFELRKIKDSLIKDSLSLDGFADYLKYIGFELITKNEFLLKLESLFNDVLKYEDEDLQEFARLHIPIVTLQIKAMERLREHQRLIKTGQSKETDLNFDIAFLIELLEWYKHSFFKWVDSPDCQNCGGRTTYKRNTTMKMETETCRVEVYICESCTASTNFPRHNCPRALLKSKRGRCGEWAACFTLLCRSLNYDTRYVYDTTDHVWCEVFDYDSNRWLHVDPCEAKLDQPLIYEHGWGKKLEYIIAFSRDDIQDVTWRYSGHHKEVRQRRILCSDLELMETILLLRKHRQKQVSEARRIYLTKRLVQELAQMLVERKPSDYDNEGRISGSLQWRKQRGELGETKSHVFDFKELGRYSIQYVTSKDEYRIYKNGGEYEIINTWCDGTFEAKNVFRKEEKDWKMVYIAREETPTIFDRRFKTLILKAELSGGHGDVSWQHAQLFRQTLMDSESTLCVELTVNEN
ncbi:Peptide-N(4)-(N-acetyl-beta-glucosaminyl) asparagine amidase [Eumeta japonica]|uniref:Peptide-N(4)-(N-acetyl-beta-glucosaminyl)asparagine amidase n=1 Tax=Eumeta variegata TaxID=151549 RepID=A0A4C1THH5_EUMVA|nr:Peptide-N(4)-(N-acetyl-beta-glucosaminyl) asparagine amidase [Eumeta japonica]